MNAIFTVINHGFSTKYRAHVHVHRVQNVLIPSRLVDAISLRHDVAIPSGENYDVALTEFSRTSNSIAGLC